MSKEKTVEVTKVTIEVPAPVIRKIQEADTEKLKELHFSFSSIIHRTVLREYAESFDYLMRLFGKHSVVDLIVRYLDIEHQFIETELSRRAETEKENLQAP